MNRLVELLARLERRHTVSGYINGGALGDITRNLLFTGLNDETAETAEIYVLALGHIALNSTHESLCDYGDGCLIVACFQCNLTY